MFLHVTVVSYLEAYRIRVEFSDGVAKEVDLRAELYGEVFEPLKDVEFFKRVRVNSETNTIEWPNGADFAPEFLYEIGQEVKRVQLGTSRTERESGVIVNDKKGWRPNIFHYATKGLSQDAMICWLIAWAGHDEDTCVDKDLRDCGRQFVQALLNLKRGERVRFRGDIKTEIRQQDKKIDVLARINEKHVLLIEDKTVAKDREDKLARYYNAVITGETCFRKVVEKDVYPIYLKTGNQSLAEDKEIEKYGYNLFHRKDFLKVLKKYSGSHPILVDFREYLQGIEGRTESYCKWTKERKTRHEKLAWEGLYRRLECELRKGADGNQWMDWGDVSNRRGGFLGFWWQPLGMDEKCPLYLQLEAPWWEGKGKLCFKVEAEGKSPEERRDLREEWHQRVCDAGEQHAARPKRMGRGKTMTVAEWKEEWLAFDGDSRLLDIDGTVENLKQAGAVLTQAVKGH